MIVLLPNTPIIHHFIVFFYLVWPQEALTGMVVTGLHAWNSKFCFWNLEYDDWEFGKQPSQQGIVYPHRSLEIESQSREHHVDIGTEDFGIEVAAEAVVCFVST